MENNNYVRFKQGTIIVDHYASQLELDHTNLMYVVDHNITNGIRKKYVGVRDITTGQPVILSAHHVVWTIEELCDTINGYYDMMQYFAGCGKEIYAHKKMNLFNRVISLARYINHNIDQLPITIRTVLYNQLILDPKELVMQEMNRILNLSDRISKIGEILKTTPGLELSFLGHDYDDNDDMDEDDEIDD